MTFGQQKSLGCCFYEGFDTNVSYALRSFEIRFGPQIDLTMENRIPKNKNPNYNYNKKV